MKKVLVLNGPNLNLLGLREPEIYGSLTLLQLNQLIMEHVAGLSLAVEFFQSNHEGALIDRIHQAVGQYDGLIINAAAYTHYSYALLDALLAVGIPAVEVHLTDITAREDFRRISVLTPACCAQFYGEGVRSYLKALDFLHQS